MKILKKAFLLFILLILSCSKVDRLSSKKTDLAQRTDFNGYLAMRYLTYSQYKADNYDWRNANYFARKGLRASKNQDTQPELPKKWKKRFILQNTNLEEFEKARKKLQVVLLNKSVKERYPLETANLQFFYDCWLSEESVYDRFDQISKCKVKFFVFMDYMEEITTPKPEEEIEFTDNSSEYLIAKRYTQEGVLYNVYFDFDSYKLNQNADQTIIMILNFLKTMKGDYKITLEGHADRVGKKLYNDALARKRVLAVKNKLTKNGVPKDAIVSVTSSGELNPKIITKNEQREKLNRRVTVKIEDLDEDFSPVPLPISPKDY